MAAQSGSVRTGKVIVGKASIREGGARSKAPSHAGMPHSAHPSLRALIDALHMSVVTIDSQGYISLVNKDRLRYGSDRDLKDLRSIRAGVNYLEVCRRAARAGDKISE